MNNFNNFNKLKILTLEGVNEGLLAGGQVIVENARNDAPETTGKLKNSIKILRNKDYSVEVGSQLDYAFYQNENNKTKSHFLDKQFTNQAEQILDAVTEKMSEKIAEV